MNARSARQRQLQGPAGSALRGNSRQSKRFQGSRPGTGFSQMTVSRNFSNQMSATVGGRMRLKQSLGLSQSKKASFLNTQCQLEQVVFNLEEAVKKFQHNELRSDANNLESSRSMLSHADKDHDDRKFYSSVDNPSNRYGGMAAKQVQGVTFYTNKNNRSPFEENKCQRISVHDVTQTPDEGTNTQLYANDKLAADPSPYVSDVVGERSLVQQSLDNKGQNVNINEFLNMNQHSSLSRPQVASSLIAQRAIMSRDGSTTRFEKSLEVDPINRRNSVSQQQSKGVVFLHSTQVKSWNEISKKAEIVRERIQANQSEQGRPLSRQYMTKYLQKTASLSHQPVQQNEVRIKYALQNYLKLKLKSANADDDTITSKKLRKQKSISRTSKINMQSEVKNRTGVVSRRSRAMSHLQTTPSQIGMSKVGRPQTQESATSLGDLLGPNRRGRTQLRNHIVQQHTDMKIMKAYELTEKVERSATQLNVSRSRERDHFFKEMSVLDHQEETPKLANILTNQNHDVIPSTRLLQSQIRDKSPTGESKQNEGARQKHLSITFTVNSDGIPESTEQDVSRPPSEPTSVIDRRGFSSHQRLGSTNIEGSKDDHAGDRDSSPSASMPGDRRQEVLKRRHTVKSIKPPREIYLGPYEKILNERRMSLRSENSNPSELDIFEVKQFGPGDASPYLKKSLRNCAPEIFEASRRQFFEDNFKIIQSVQHRQSILLSSVSQSVEKMLIYNQRNCNSAGVQIQYKNLHSQQSLTEERIDDLFWARMEDLKNGPIPYMKNPKIVNALRDVSKGKITHGRQSQKANITSGKDALNDAERQGSIDKDRNQKLNMSNQQNKNKIQFSSAKDDLNFNHDQKKRFFEICKQQCINRKIKLVNLALGPKTAQELRQILEEDQAISQLILSENCLGDEGVKVLAPYLQGITKNIRQKKLTQPTSPSEAQSPVSRHAGKLDQTFAENISLQQKGQSIQNKDLIGKDRDQMNNDDVKGQDQFLNQQDVPFKMSHSTRFSELVVLDLSQNQLTSAGATLLFQSLRNNQTIVQLSLGNNDARHKNNVGAKGARALRDLLQMNQTLSILDLKGNALCDQGMFQLCQGLKHNTGLIQLNVSQNGFSAFGIEFLKDALAYNVNNNLQELDISFNNIEHHGVTHLSALMQIDHLKLVRLKAENCGVQGLHSLNFFRGIKKCQTLRQIRAEKNDFSHPMLLRAVTSALANSLREIYFEYCCLGTQGAMNVARAIELNKQIKVVSLKGNNIEKQAAQHFANLMPTRSLHLEMLDLSENLLYDDGGKLIADGLSKNESLKRLYLASNSLEKSSGKAFRNAVEKNRVILVLNLGDNHIDLGILVDIKSYLDRNKDLVNEQEIQDLRKEERDIEREKNYYNNETKSMMIKERKGLNKKKRQVREEERRMREDLAYIVTSNQRDENELKLIQATNAQIDESGQIQQLKIQEDELAKALKKEQRLVKDDIERTRVEKRKLKDEIEFFKQKLEGALNIDEELKTAHDEKERAFKELIAMQEEYAAFSNFTGQDKGQQNPIRENDPNAIGTKATGKGKGGTKASGTSTPAEKANRPSKAKRESKKK